MNFDLPVHQFVGYIPLIEKFLLAEDKQKFIDSLPKQGTESTFLKLCIENHKLEDYQKLADKLGLQWHDREKLSQLQYVKTLLSPTASDDEKNKVIDLVREKLNLRFDHSKPTNASSSIHQNNEGLKLESELRADQYTLDKYLQRYNHQGVYSNLTLFGLAKVHKDKIENLNLRDYDSVIGAINLSALGDGGLDILRKYHEKKKQENKNYTLSNELYSKLTAEQLTKLPNYIEEVNFSQQYVFETFKKTIGYEIETEFRELDNRLYSKDKLNRKRELLKRGIEWAEKNKVAEIESLINLLTLEYLSINILVEEPELDIFFKYLSRPRNPIEAFTPEHQSLLRSYTPIGRLSYFDSILQFQKSLWPRDDVLIEKYLTIHFKRHSNTDFDKRFGKFFKVDYINKILYRVRLEKGQETGKLSAIFTQQQEANLKNKKQLTIWDLNKKKFNVKEPVSLKLLVKNISEITAEIYQISTQKHYLSSSSQIDNSISLEFLEPLKKVTQKVSNDNPFKINEVEFNLTEHLGAKNSIFIVNFQGEGVLSRAVIKRGSIVCIQRPTLAGIQLKFYQEDGTPIENLDIWLRGKKLNVNGKYTIPYGQSRQNLNLIAVKDDYAELVQVSVQQQKYTWNISYTYHQENFLVGSKAKVLLHAQLSSNSGTVNSQALKDTNIVVNIVNHLDIPSSLSFNNIKWDPKNEYQLQIPVQAYLKEITINVTAKVDKYVGKAEELTSTKKIQFVQQAGKLNFIQFFLSSTSEGYFLNVLGKNGQAKPSVTVTLKLYSKLFTNFLDFTLITDKNGQIKLGKLKDVKTLAADTVNTNDMPFNSGVWNFNSSVNEVSYPNFIAQKEGEQLYLPVYSQFQIQHEVFLFKTHGDDVISNESNRLSFDNNRLHFSLPKGSYILFFLALDKQIKIEVTKLEQWGASKILIDNETRTIYNLPAQTQDPVSLPNDFNKNQNGDQYKISLKLEVKDEKNLENVRVHVIASTFTYRNNYSQQLSEALLKNKSTTTKLALKDNISSYLNDKELSDEHCYILNRQKEDKFIGNNLERPRVLLKRTFNRDTVVNKEELASERNFQTKSQFYSKKLDSIPRACKSKVQNFSYVYGAGNSGAVTLFNNFLKYPSVIIPNQHGSTIQFSIPKHYQSFVVIVASPSFAFQKLYSLNPITHQTNNLINLGLKETSPQQAYTISRESYKLQKGEHLTVKKSSQWTSVSASNLSILSQINSSNIFEWVMNWPTYTEEKKLKVYDEFVCHQLNTYIKYKDADFFNRVVKGFIANKLEKGVVDYCLLEDKEALKYSKLENYRQLNSFEKCLVIEYLSKNNELEKAKSMAQGLALEFKSYKSPFSEYERKFDTLMSSKLITKPVAPALAAAAYGGYGGGMNYDMMCSEQVMYKCAAPPPMRMMAMQMQHMQQQCDYLCDQAGDNFAEQLQQRGKFKPGFEQVEKTKQYVETTYYEMKDPSFSSHHILLNKFWVSLAEHFVNPQKQFLTQNFIYLTSRQELSLAVAFLPLPLTAQYNIRSEDQNVIITAESPFIVFVKEIKKMEYNNKYGVLINQRISDPNDEFEYEEDGTMLQKKVGQFIKDKPYYLQTVVTNTSPTNNLELQILIDIPEGSIPLSSNEYTQVVSQTIGAFQTRSFKNAFYFPQAGEFVVYPANASKNRQVISKANSLEKIIVRNQRTVKKLETLDDVLVSGSKDDILNFLKNKNIFDSSTFNVYSILWLLKDKGLYEEISKIFKDRAYYSREVFEFAFFHKDKNTVREFIEGELKATPFYERVFEYYPLTSQRVHKFMKAQKSTILNQTFKETYQNFLVNSLATRRIDSALFQIVFTYYLILQDRVKEANQVFVHLSKLKNQANFPQIQYDYVACFLDMYTGYPNFAVARNISQTYVDNNNLVETWKKLFKQVNDLLTHHDVAVYNQEESQQHDIKITIKNNQLSVFLPEKTTVEINFHAVNLELMFSNSPFDDAKLFSTIKPFSTVTVTSEKGGEQFVDRPEGYANIYVHPVELSSTKQGQTLPSFHWANSSVKVKLVEDEGIAYVFVDGKPKPGAYCKVYAQGNETRFYKDGYTDIQGKFKYVSQLDDVKRFSILFITEKGGITKFARIPSKNGVIA